MTQATPAPQGTLASYELHLECPCGYRRTLEGKDLAERFPDATPWSLDLHRHAGCTKCGKRQANVRIGVTAETVAGRHTPRPASSGVGTSPQQTEDVWMRLPGPRPLVAGDGLQGGLFPSPNRRRGYRRGW